MHFGLFLMPRSSERALGVVVGAQRCSLALEVNEGVFEAALAAPESCVLLLGTHILPFSISLLIWVGSRIPLHPLSRLSAVMGENRLPGGSRKSGLLNQ